jgi:prophage DNA circulation protein
VSINANSRYSQSKIVTLYTDSGEPRQTIVAGEQFPFVVNYIYHQVTGSERIDQLAYQFYRDSTRWWVIADANPQIMDWSTLTTGTLIRIPTSG